MLHCVNKETIWDRLRIFWERKRASLWAAFPERQIILRAEGRVRCFVFSPRVQISMAGSTLLLAAWVAFTSINMVVQSQIIAAEHHRLRQAQALYDARTAAIDEFEAQQNAFAAIIERKQQLGSSLRYPADEHGAGPAPAAAASAEDNAADNNSASSEANSDEPAVAEPPGRRSSAPQPRRESFLTESGSTDHAMLRQFEAHDSWLAALKARQLTLLRKLGHSLEIEGKKFRQALQNTGFVPDAFLARNNDADDNVTGRGGPLLYPSKLPTDTEDREYLAQLADAADSLDTLTNVVQRMNAVPWLRPTDADYGTASGFGVRLDPFTNRRAFHSGLDMSGPWGLPVHATAPGTVIYAGRRGAYGNTVEIDHGYGFRTRYGHLRSTSVHAGAWVERGTQVGSLGSTGRSTGPHLHYEVWYENGARDPQKFIKAGQLLLQE